MDLDLQKSRRAALLDPDNTKRLYLLRNRVDPDNFTWSWYCGGLPGIYYLSRSNTYCIYFANGMARSISEYHWDYNYSSSDYYMASRSNN